MLKYVKKEELIAKCHSLGMVDVHMAMTRREIEGIYDSWIARKAQEKVDKKTEVKVTASIAPTISVLQKKKKFHVQSIGDSIAVPETIEEIDLEETSTHKVRDNKYVVLFKAGPKVEYNLKTGKRIRLKE